MCTHINMCEIEKKKRRWGKDRERRREERRVPERGGVRNR